jgi:hypothetical protein
MHGRGMMSPGRMEERISGSGHGALVTWTISGASAKSAAWRARRSGSCEQELVRHREPPESGPEASRHRSIE